MAPLSFVRSIFVLSLLATSAIARPTHGIRPRHKGCPTGAIPHTTAAAPVEDPATSPKVTVASTDSPSYGKGQAQADDDATTTKPKPKSGKTTTSPAADPTETPKAPTTGAPSGGNGRVAALTPVSGAKQAVSFSDAFPDAEPLSALPVIRQAKTSKFTPGTFQGRKALKTVMSKGSIAPGGPVSGGMSFYSPAKELQTNGKKHYLFSYSVFFEDGFDFNLGGKLPGLFGGTSLDEAGRCSGGKHSPKCFSTRLMWRQGGEAELYAYIPLPTAATRSYNKNDKKCGRNASGQCSGDYGYSIGRGAWKWTPGVWTTVAQRIKLNTVGQADGEAEIFVNGKSVLNVKGLVYREDDSSHAFGRQMQTFFGGHTTEWASPKDQDIYFADMTTAILD